ncbi:hypothetical protein RN001_012008 [Aquatica leii]|uniref:RanBD1 domain-containing protein n=1 Tax=Aquatica leii TaxID=1421715 RepID=A0AAN7P6Q4_9COLE|nr:hypothetical protein RN001_012008 [Aquatica leii]
MADSSRGDDCKSSQDINRDKDQTKPCEESDNGSSVLEIETPKICSPSSFFANPRLKVMEQTSKKCVLKSPSLLRPSQLNGSIGNTPIPSKHSFLLNPSRLNPFDNTTSETRNQTESKSTNVPSSTTAANTALKFLPLVQNGNKSEVSKSTPSTSTITQSSNFIFGQNIHDRVVSNNQTDDKKINNSENSNGSCDMLFSSVIKENSNSLTDATSSTSQATKSLSESAREYEESRAIKRKFEEVEVITGEEGEKNILQITCKLFAFDKLSGGSWQERGRGILRLNDQETEDGTQSRLVFRASGSLRVVLNTKIWAEMTIELASNKSIRFMAFDASGEVKVFLLTGSQDDVKQLFRLLEIRLQKEISRQKGSKTKASPTELQNSSTAVGTKSDKLNPNY